MLKRLAGISLLAAGLAEPPALMAPPDPNSFANSYNRWIVLQNLAQPGGLNIHEVKAWQEVKAEWPAFRRMIDARY